MPENLPAGKIKSIMSSIIDITFDLGSKKLFEMLKEVVDFLWELLRVIKRWDFSGLKGDSRKLYSKGSLLKWRFISDIQES